MIQDTGGQGRDQRTSFNYPAPSVVLQVDRLGVGFQSSSWPYAVLPAVEDVSFALYGGKILCLVGESGCGKSVTARSVLRLLPSPPARYLSGSILFSGQDLAVLPEKQLQHIRGNNIGMVFQEPMTSLNPVFTIGFQVAEHLVQHKKISRAEAKGQSIAMLGKTGIPDPGGRWGDYPHQLSGGMRQRVMIAMAMACSPDVLIADEPTTALDVSIRQQILALMEKLVKEKNSAMLLITHDFDVVRQIGDHVAVMYAGSIVEQGSVQEVLASPLHPYTQQLLASLPQAVAGKKGHTRQRLSAIPGTVPPLGQRPLGCSFHPRCRFAVEQCKTSKPTLSCKGPDAWELHPRHGAACWRC